MNPYHNLVAEFGRLYREGKKLPLGDFTPLPRPSLPSDAPRVLIFSPHPDDECIIGGWPLRLMREHETRVINVAVTQGSNKARQQARLEELRRCCDYVGFDLVQTAQNGLENIHLKARSDQPEQWGKAVARIVEILNEHRPMGIFFPHDRDRNSTHLGTHQLILDALGQMGTGFNCYTIETEFWGAMETPNLMIESSEADVSALITALTFHVGEVQRNPYHLRLPAWMMDNVRRGGELVGSQGGAVPDFGFATLYRLRQLKLGKLEPVLQQGRFVSQTENVKVGFSYT